MKRKPKEPSPLAFLPFYCGQWVLILTLSSLHSASSGPPILLAFPFVFVGGASLALLIRERVVKHFSRSKPHSSAGACLMKSHPKDLSPDVRHLADMLASRHQELRARIKRTRKGTLARAMKKVEAEADSVVCRSVEILRALQTLNESVEKSMRGRLQMATCGDSHAGSVWESSLKRAQGRITDCQCKVKGTIDLLDSILLRLSGLEMESVDGRSIADAVAGIHREIEALEEAYGELAAAEEHAVNP